MKYLFCMLLFICSFPAQAEVLSGNPDNYRQLLKGLLPGDTLKLADGVYENGLPIHNLNGQPNNPIVIAGPERGPRPVFWGSSVRNTVSIVNSSYIEICNLKLDGRGLDGDAVKAEGHADWAHHITLENLLIVGHGADQQIVGINTKCPTWDWIVRRNVIVGAGTGMYFGNSDGRAPFVNGLIEHNLIVNTSGYNLQIKHQIGRPNLPGMPARGTTLIRHNVFSKAQNGASGNMARPTVLVGHWPSYGSGSKDVYQIYGNFFFENPSEALFQGEGNIALYNNLFVNNYGNAIRIQPHHDLPRMIRIFNNTVVARGTGITVYKGSVYHKQKIIGNAVFASVPIQAPEQEDNITAAYHAASNYLVSPTGSLGRLDLYPKAGMLQDNPIDKRYLKAFVDSDTDFNGAKHDGSFRGAYAGEGRNPGWRPKLEIKRLISQRGRPWGARQ